MALLTVTAHNHVWASKLSGRSVEEVRKHYHNALSIGVTPRLRIAKGINLPDGK